MGRDDINKQLDYHDYISIHSPRMGRDPSVRRFFQNLGYFNPLSPHGERHTIFQIYQWTNRISIHSPHTGRDFLPFPMLVHRVDFNPLSPHGERPFTLTQPSRSPLISIHSPHTGRDCLLDRHRRRCAYFNPLSPHGERPIIPTVIIIKFVFQSTLPTRGETIQGCICNLYTPISIRSPHTGRDPFYLPIRIWCTISIHSPHTGRDEKE